MHKTDTHTHTQLTFFPHRTSSHFINWQGGDIVGLSHNSDLCWRGSVCLLISSCPAITRRATSINFLICGLFCRLSIIYKVRKWLTRNTTESLQIVFQWATSNPAGRDFEAACRMFTCKCDSSSRSRCCIDTAKASKRSIHREMLKVLKAIRISVRLWCHDYTASQVRHGKTSSFILKQSKYVFSYKTPSKRATTATVFRSEFSLGLTSKVSCVSMAWHWSKSPKWQLSYS